MFSIFSVSGSALSAQSQRLNVVASNLANVDAVAGPDGESYKARQVVFQTAPMGDEGAAGVKVVGIKESDTPGRKVYSPEHPLADEQGYVTHSNVSAVDEMVDMISASRSYQNNVEVMNTAKTLLLKTLQLGQSALKKTKRQTAMFTPISNTAANASAANGQNGFGATNAADMQNQFLTLLVAQLKNQDPTAPMDNAQMTSQMAQISTVTGIEKLNDTVNSVTSQFSTVQMLQGSNLIGRTVLSEGNALGVAVQETEDADGNKTTTTRGTAAFDLDGVAGDVQVQITNASGQVIDTLQLGAANPGRNYFTWDGSNYDGDVSNLQFKVVATNGQDTVQSTALAPQAVVGTSITDQGMVLELANGKSIGYSNVKAVF